MQICEAQTQALPLLTNTHRSRNDMEEAASRFRPEDEGSSPRALLMSAVKHPEFVRKMREHGFTDDRDDEDSRQSMLRLLSELEDLYQSYNYTFIEQYLVRARTYTCIHVR